MVKTLTLSNLPKSTKRSKKRIGRGHGSGKVKTSGRGTKGQNARGHMPSTFEGGQLSIVRRLPFLRGKNRNKPTHTEYQVLSISKLGSFSKGSTITLASLEKARIIKEGVKNVKIVGSEKLSVALNVQIPCSGPARESIQKAGGTVQ